jgi:hypothetical protein
MGMKFYDNGRIRDSDDLELAEKIIDLKNKKDPWEVIDELIKVWAKRSPDEEKAIRIEVEDHKQSLNDKEFGQTNGGKDFERRFVFMMPLGLQNLIRAIYKPSDLPFDREFNNKFAKRYPYFRIAEKVE